jgi:hypothetical protein
VPPESRPCLEAIEGRIDDEPSGWSNPLAPDSRVQSQGLVGTDPVTMVWIAVLIAVILTIFCLPFILLVWHAVQ